MLVISSTEHEGRVITRERSSLLEVPRHGQYKYKCTHFGRWVAVDMQYAALFSC